MSLLQKSDYKNKARYLSSIFNPYKEQNYLKVMGIDHLSDKHELQQLDSDRPLPSFNLFHSMFNELCRTFEDRQDEILQNFQRRQTNHTGHKVLFQPGPLVFSYHCGAYSEWSLYPFQY
jgi:ATP sulfurylase